MAKIIVNDGEGESEFALTESGATIGRVAKQCEIVIKVPEASRQHCRVKHEGGSWFVEDLGSSNGTRVNGRKVTTFELQDGDEIQVGKASLRFLESDVVVDEISLEDDGDVELEISLEEDSYLRFLNTDRKDEKVVFAGRMTFGRRSSNTVSMEEKGVSGNHTEFVSEAGEWVCRDLGSTNGTIVNGETAVEARLSAGDRVRIGTVEFVFGVGDDEGSGMNVATVLMEEMPLEEEIFAISEANMKRKQKAATLFWLIFVVAVAGGGVWWLMQGDSGTRSSKEIEVVTGNQLGIDGNFEPREDDEDYLTTDSDAIDFVEITKRKASGTRALEVKVSDGEGDHYVTFTRAVENISTADRITVGGKIRTAGATGGGVGFSVLWRDAAGRQLGASHANAPTGESSFVTVEGLFMPPVGSDSAIVAIGFHDATGKIVVDDVYALRSRGGGKTAVAHGYDFHLDASAALIVSRDGAEILDHGGLYALEGKTPRFLGRLFAATPDGISGDEASRSVSGYLSQADGADAEFSARSDGNAIAWSGSVGGSSDLFVGFRIDAQEGLVTVNGEGARRHTEDFNREGVRELVVAAGPRALRFAFDTPTNVQMITGKRGAVVLMPINTAGDDKRGFSHRIQVDFKAELDQVNTLNDKARNADLSRKAYGEAMACYAEIVNRYSFNKDVSDRASARLAQLSAKAETALARLNKEVDNVLFFRTFDADRAKLKTELTEFAVNYKGSNYEKQFVAATERLDASYGEVTQSRRLMMAENHLMRGRDLMQPGNSAPILARGFFLSVLRLAPEGELADAANSELDKIKQLLGSK